MSNTIFNKKAAMFGLDARIALAIFGALSVISGAALYSAIQSAKVISYVTEMNEISKAVEAYMLDTGENLTKFTASDSKVDLSIFYTSSVNNWKGPYLSLGYLSDYSSLNARFSDPDSSYALDIVDDAEDLGGLVHSSSGGCTTSAISCTYWVRGVRVSLEEAKAIDLAVDGVSDDSSGNLRYSYHSGTDAYFIWFRGPKSLSAY
jgi:hypothetical protein